jgi:hypothetical protein
VTISSSVTDSVPGELRVILRFAGSDSYAHGMAVEDIRKEHVLAAVAEYDRLGQEAFLEKYGFGRSRTARLLCNGRFYDSTPIVAAAHGFATGEIWTKEDVASGDGASNRSVSILLRLGFRVDNGMLFNIEKLQPNIYNGKRAPYQYIVLLWAYARARDGLQRMVPFNDVRDELAGLLAPFAIANTAPDPAMPWAALGNSEKALPHENFYQLWESDRQGLTTLTDADVKRLNIVGGLARGQYESVGYVLDDAAEIVGRFIGGEPAFPELLTKLGLNEVIERAAEGSPGRSAEVFPDEAAEAVEAAINPRGQFGQSHNAAENKAIEEHAVRVVCEDLEKRQGYATEDVGKTRSYDIHATRGDEVLKVEVKGTTRDGASVTLTRKEVELHQAGHPGTALAVVRRIVLDRSGDKPVAAGGVLEWVEAWPPVDERLKPIAYYFQTGL